MTNEDDYTKTVGFGYDQSELDGDTCNLLNMAIAGYLVGYLRGNGENCRPQVETNYQSDRVFYTNEYSMHVTDLFALRLLLPENLRNRVRLYKVATRMVPEVVAIAIGDIEMTDMKEES